MDYIELIGPPAVGKTTLLTKLVDKRKQNATWKTHQEAVIDIADNLHWQQLNTLNERGLFLLNKLNFLKYKKLGISNILLHKLTGQISDTALKKYEYLLDAQLKSIEFLGPRISSINKCSFITWHLKALNQLCLMESFAYNNTILFTEGPLKTHYGLEHLHVDDITEDTLPNAIINCTIDLEENVKRIARRLITTGRVSKVHNKLNDANLDQLVTFTHNIAVRNIMVIKNLGIPVFDINLSQPVAASELEALSDFLARYSKKSSDLSSRFVTS